MEQGQQSFLTGINRRFSREDSLDPSSFFTLQNCRLFNRGDTGKVQRIKGFTKFNSTLTDYTNTLDIIPFKDKFVVFYEDATTPGTFHLEVFDSAGTSEFSETYTDFTTSTGQLTQSENTIFIAPHNKILFFDGTTWHLTDFIPTVPDVTIAATGTGSEATATIEPTSAPTATTGTKAFGSIEVTKNNVPKGAGNMIWNITIGGNTSADITTTYTHTEEDIAEAIYEACVNSAIATDPNGYTISYTNSDTKRKLLAGSERTVFFEAKLVGVSTDKFVVTSAYNIPGEVVDNTSPGGAGSPLPEFGGTGFQDGTGGGTSFISPLDPGAININSTLVFQHPLGSGSDPESTNFGPLHIRFQNVGITVITDNILSTDTEDTIADKITAAFDASDLFAEHFTYTRNDITFPNKITINTIRGGKKLNGRLSVRRLHSHFLVPIDDVFTATITDFTGGAAEVTNQSLEEDTDYWYTARYRYKDGYITPTVNPLLINTGPSKAVSLTITTTEKDIDGTRPKLQIFRRKEGGPFQFITEVQPTDDSTLVPDVGEIPKDSLEEQTSIFTKSHQAQDILENRYVKANIEYFDETYDPGTFALATAPATDDKTIPENTKASIYVRPTYEDGSKGYFSSVGVLDVTSSDNKLEVTQTALAVNDDKTISELGVFANYQPLSEKFSFPFNTPELANKNIPTIANPNFYPSRTRVFFGFKYLELWNEQGAFKVFGWDSGEQVPVNHAGFFFEFSDESETSGATAFGGKFPRKVTTHVFGTEVTYVRIGARNTGADLDSAVYKLDLFESLQQAVQTQKLRLQLKHASVNNLSSNRTREELFNTEVAVTGLIDTSSSYTELNILPLDDDFLVGPFDSRLYLELEESALDDIDNKSINRYDFSFDYKTMPSFHDWGHDLIGGFPLNTGDVSRYALSFNLINFRKVADSVFDPYTSTDVENDNGRPRKIDNKNITIYGWDWADYHLIDFDLVGFDSVIYLGSKTNAIDTKTFDVTGYEFKKSSDLFYSRLEESNIYHNLILEKDIIGETTFKNQLIWSDPLVLGNKLAGGRSFDLENFLNVSSENGQILAVKSLGNKLYVFCERGVALVNVGEVLTSQRSGEVFVDSSGFLTSYYWIGTEFSDIKKNSIIKVKNRIFFTDGYDTFQIAGREVQNISSGTVPLDPDNQYAATLDVPNYEYKLSDITSAETWVYNFEFGQWYGPFTYITSAGASNKNLVISGVGSDLVQHNTGNTFNGGAYTTLIQSVANDSELSAYDKSFRKFYIQSNNDTNTTFKYGRDPTGLTSVAMSAMRLISGERNQGVAPAHTNSKVIFWDIETQDEGFELRDITWVFNLNRRRRR